MINQWYNHEKYSFILQIHELRELLSLTQQNLTNTIHQVKP